MDDQGGRKLGYRGSFACIGSDDQIHSVEANLDSGGAVMLMLDDGRRVRRILKGKYVADGGKPLFLRCDHPDAP